MNDFKAAVANELGAIDPGPTVQNVLSPDERLEVATVKKVYDQIVATLAQIK
jgi:di/tripeptidase